jgi:hypothetical protein
MKSFFEMFNLSRKKSRKKTGFKKVRQDTIREECDNRKCVCFLNNKKMNCKKAKKIYTKRHPIFQL